MSLALQKTLSLIVLIGLGVFLKRKIVNEDQVKGIKTIVLDMALPAMIFVALMKVEINVDLLFLPVLALVFNLIMLGAMKYLMPFFGIEPKTPAMRTMMLMMPSLAPGLTCFPFVVAYLGDDVLAWAALADIGNKLFFLIFAYLLAMSMFYRHQELVSQSNGQKIKQLLLAMLQEPINLVILVAITLLLFGLNLESLPGFMTESILMMKDMMTPLVLLFIGIAVVLKWDQLKMITSLLLFRAGITFICSAILVFMLPLPTEAAILLAVVFPQSAVSFWPFAHMAAVRKLERDKKTEMKKEPTFDLELGINLLAVSMPFSTLLILGVFSFGNYFTSYLNLLIIGAILVIASVIPKFVKMIAGSDFSLSSATSD